MDLNILIIVATVPTGLQTFAMLLQMHFSGGRGTPWLQPKSNVTFTFALFDVFKTLASDFLLNVFIVVATVPTGLQTCVKLPQVHLSGGGGTPCLQPKSNETFKKNSRQ